MSRFLARNRTLTVGSSGGKRCGPIIKSDAENEVVLIVRGLVPELISVSYAGFWLLQDLKPCLCMGSMQVLTKKTSVAAGFVK